jgi:hypothetical protein
MTSSVNQVNATSTTNTSFVSSDILGLLVNAEAEITPGSVITPYSNNMAIIANSLKLATNPSADLTTYAALMQAAVTNLINLARDGVTQRINPNEPASDTNPVTQYYLTKQMGDSLGPVFQLLKEAGATIITTTNPPTVSISADQLRKFLDLSLTTPDVANLVGTAQNATDYATSTFQAMIELIYCGTANTVLEGSLQNQQQALQIAQDTESTLNSVQSTHNEVSLTSNPSLITNPSTNVPSDWTAAYEASLESALAPIGIYITSPNAMSDLMNEQAALHKELTTLATVAGTDSDIYQRVQAVSHDIDTALAGGVTGVAAWFADGWSEDKSGGATKTPQNQVGTGSSASSGEIQNNINLALSSCQSFNNTQTQEVSRQLFVFEQYYTSASSMLTDLSGIIERIGQRCSGN